MGRRKREPGPAGASGLRSGARPTARPGEAGGERRARAPPPPGAQRAEAGAAAASARGPGTGVGRGPRRARCRAAMAGYVPGQQPANRSQEKEFVQAYEDVLERYKGAARPAPGWGPGRRGVAFRVRCRWGGGRGRAHRRWGRPPGCGFSGPVHVQNWGQPPDPSPGDGTFRSASYGSRRLSGPAGRKRYREPAPEPSCCGSCREGASGPGAGSRGPAPCAVVLPEARASACPPRVPRPFCLLRLASIAWQPGCEPPGFLWGRVRECAVLVAGLPPPSLPGGFEPHRFWGLLLPFSKIKIYLGARISAPGGSLAKQCCKLMAHLNLGCRRRKF